MGGQRPGKFPATIKEVDNSGVVILQGHPEDTEYLVPFVGQVVTVDITPGHADGGADGGASGGTGEGQGPQS